MVIINAPTGPFPGVINVADSVTGTGLPSSSIQLLGDVAAPGASMLYGTNSLGQRGWYPIPVGGSGSVGILTPVDSITGGGSMSTNLSISLVNDNPNPGNSKLYGTGVTGILGWYAQPSGPSVGILTAIDSIAGGGSMTANITLSLVGDVPSPGVNTYYGSQGGARGFYQIPYASLSGLPSIPTVGTLTTSDSFTGGGAMTGNLTLSLVNDVITPANGQFYGYAASARGWITPPTVSTSVAGYAPASGGGTVNFLRADGAWAAPAGSGGTPYLTTFGTFTIPAAGSGVNVAVGVNTDMVVGQQHVLTDGTHFIFATIGTISGTTITYVNNGGGGNTSGIMAAGHVYMGSGPEPTQVATAFLSGVNTFITPPTATATTAGYVSPPNNVAQVYRGDASWQNFSSFTFPWTQLTGVPNNTISAAGIVATAPNNANQVWTGTATWGFPGPGSTVSLAFTIPAAGASTPISIQAATWPVVGQTVWIGDGTNTGFFEISVVASSTAITIINRGYLGNSVSGTMALGAQIEMASPGLMTSSQPGFVPAGTGLTTQVLLGTGVFGSLAYSSLTGLPSIPSVGTLTTSDSLTGGGAMTGNLTVTLVGDVTTPTNGQFYGYSGSARGWFTPAYASITGTPSVEPNTTTSSAFTMLAVGTQMTVAINSATWPIVGQLVAINDGTHFGTFEITTVTSAISIGVTNRGFLGTPVTGSMGSGATVILSGYGLFGSSNAGCVPASGGGSANFLCANGTWATPAGGGGGTPYLTTNATFSIPAVNVATAGFTVGTVADMIVGQTHLITDGTHFVIGKLASIAGTTVTYLNTGGAGNVTGTMAAGHIYMVAGPQFDFVTTHWLRGDNTFTVIPYASVTGTPSVEPNTTTTSSFSVPAVGVQVTVAITSASWPIIGQTLAINDGTNFGFFEVTAVTSGISIGVTNRGYLGTPVATTIMGSGATVILASPGLMTGTQPGFAPAGTGSAIQYLNGTGAFSALLVNSTSQAGIVSTAPADVNKVYRGDASWNFVGAVTETNGTFTVPAAGASVGPINIVSASWPVVGQNVWISDGTHVGFFQITAVGSATQITIKNMGYQGNSTSGTMGTAALVQLMAPSICTATQPGDVPAPPNNTYQFFNGQAVFATPVLTYAGFVAYDNIPYSTTYPAFNTRGGYGLPVLDCVKSIETDCLFSAVMPQNANLGSGLTIVVKWTAHVATTGSAVFQAQYARLNGSIAAATFSGAATTTTATSGTIDTVATTLIAIASTTITAGDLYLIMVSRLGANGSDTLSDTVEILSVEVRSAGT